MAMDKDALVKHKFWVMLAVAAPLALGAIFLLLTVVSSSIASLRKANEDAVKNIRPPADAKNEKNVDVKKDEAVKVTKTKDQAWEEAWLQQAHFFTWPKAFEEMGIDFQNGFFVTEAKVVKELPAKIEEKNKVAGVIDKSDLEGNFFRLKGGKKYPRTGSLIVTDERGNDKEKRRSLEDLAPGDLVVLTLQKSRYFDEPLTTVERDNYPKTSFYYSQLDAILAQVTPVNDKGKGIVWLGNLPYREGKWPRGARFFHYVPFPWDTDHDISSEAWIAQEDLWIQRELYYRIKVANDYLSNFEGKGKEGFNEPVKFTNPYWDLTLTLQGSEDDNKLLVKLKNRLPRRQKVSLSFKIKFHKNQTAEEIEVSEAPVDPADENNEGRKDTVTITKTLERGVPRDGIYSVEQVLTVNTAAVKRIEQIAIGTATAGECAFSHRTIVEGLRALKADPEKKDDPTAKSPSETDPAKLLGRLPGGFNPAEAGKAQKDNGLNKIRYQEVTEQFRRLPIALVLVVDQDHIERVLTSFRNSPFRFKITQFTLNRYAQTLEVTAAGQAGDKEAAGADVGNPGGIRPFDPNPFMRRPGAIGPMPPGGLPGLPGSGTPSAAPDDQEVSIELVIYGEITIYNRYPPRQAAAEQKN